MVKSRLLIYCDGGLGNRLNAYLSGLAIAHHFQMDYMIHWPINQWCAAEYADLFSPDANVSTESLTSLNGKLGGYAMLLHDSIASDALSAPFASAYDYASLDDFESRILNSGQSIFFYPALVPQWIPETLIHAEMRNLHFTPYITLEVENFIRSTLKKPFHGLHLRRTDLNIGLTDLEVFKIAQGNPDCAFFVCSDDPQAERLASGHPNVFSRSKSSYVQKKQDGDDWLALSKDEDGRAYHGNIQRDKASVIDGAIDMLILAHSQIVGFSGSTFQTMARNLGQYWSKLNWEKPETLKVFPMREIQRQIEFGLLPIDNLIYISNIWYSDNINFDHLNIITKALDKYNGEDFLQLLFALAQFYVRQQNSRMACLFLREILRISPNRKDPLQMLGELQKIMS